MKIVTFQRFRKTVLRILFVLFFLIVSLAPVSGVSRAQVPQTSCYEIWNYPITVADNNGNSKTLVIGQGLFATSNLDDCDKPAPPQPPAGAFDARLFTSSTDYFTDYRLANQPGTIIWEVMYRASTNGNPITLSWTPAALPGAGTWYLVDYFNGLFVNVNMRTQGSVVVTNTGVTQLQIIYSTSRCTVTAITSGNWNALGTWNTNCTGIPSTTDDVYIPGGLSVNYNNAGITTIESLTIGSGSTLTLNFNGIVVSDNAFVRGGAMNLGTLGALTVNGALTNLGVMQQTKAVNVLDGNAPEATQTFLNIGGYGGLTLTSNATSMGSTTVSIFGGRICDANNTSAWRCFMVTPTTSVSDAGIVFYYAANELNTSACATLEAWRSTGGHNWTSAGTAGTRSCAPEPYSLPYTAAIIANTGSFFALRSATGPTAITLRAFNAGSVGNNFSILLAVGLVGLASLGVFAAWRAFGKRQDFFERK